MLFRRTFLVGLFVAAAIVPALSAVSVNAADDDDSNRVGTVYTLSNTAADNQVLVFDQLKDGSLRSAGSVSTGGRGSGGGLGNQGALAVSRDRDLLFSVNAGSNEISVFKLEDRRQPKLVNKIASGGIRPVSLTVRDHLLYVVNAGSDTAVGFSVDEEGKLSQLPNSSRPLSGVGTGPAQIGFSPDGNSIIVTEKATNLISIFPVRDNYLGERVSNRSVSNTPFGFAFDKRQHLLVSEAVGGAVNGSSISSYELWQNDQLRTITPSAATNQTAACWVAISRNSRYAYVSNTGSSTLSGFAIRPDGSLSALDNGQTASTGQNTGPTDMSFSPNGQFLNTLNPRNGTIVSFRLKSGGALENAATIANIPNTATGLVVR